MAAQFFLRNARIVRLDGAGRQPGTCDVRICGGRIVELAPRLEAAGLEVIEADGRWLIPGLWDRHVHFGVWANARTRLDLAGTASPEDVVDRVRARLAIQEGGPVFGFGYRRAGWAAEPTTAALDTLSCDRPIALTSGDAHSGWLNSLAQRMAGIAQPYAGLLVEQDWFSVIGLLDRALGTEGSTLDALRDAQADAASRGVVGVVDFDFDDPWQTWVSRVGFGIDRLRVEAACYPDSLGAVVSQGLRSGDRLDHRGLITMGPLKVISDGSLGTLTAHCRHPYAGGDSSGAGQQNVDQATLVELLGTAGRHGLGSAVHAIGDAALEIAIDAIEASGVRGSVEHVQLARPADIAELKRLGVTASVQPAHLLDDRELVGRYWPGDAEDCFPLGSLHAAGVRLALGSDAPVAALDPWLAMATAVHRGRAGEPSWTPHQQISPAAALLASVNGQRVEVGARADLALTTRHPLPEHREAADAGSVFREMGVDLTVCAGNITHSRLG